MMHVHLHVSVASGDHPLAHLLTLAAIGLGGVSLIAVLCAMAVQATGSGCFAAITAALPMIAPSSLPSIEYCSRRTATDTTPTYVTITTC